MDSRRFRALTQEIYLVKLRYVPETELIFNIVGSRQKVYTVTFPKGDVPMCSCPDATIRQACCKHIQFVALKILDGQPARWPGKKQLSDVHSSILYELPHLDVHAPHDLAKRYGEIVKLEERGEKKGDRGRPRNDECAICLCDLTDADQPQTTGPSIVACHRCKNAVHALCWDKWEHVHRSGCCVYCRQPRGMVTDTKAGGRDAYGLQL